MSLLKKKKPFYLIFLFRKITKHCFFMHEKITDNQSEGHFAGLGTYYYSIPQSRLLYQVGFKPRGWGNVEPS